jgi:hypothetical protein
MLEEATVMRPPVDWLKMTAPLMVLTAEAPAGVEGAMALVVGDGRTDEVSSEEDDAAGEVFDEYGASELDVDEKLEEVVEEVAEGVVEAAGEGVVEAAREEVVKAAGEGVVQAAGEGVVEAAAEGVVQAAGEGVVEAAAEVVVFKLLWRFASSRRLVARGGSSCLSALLSLLKTPCLYLGPREWRME